MARGVRIGSKADVIKNLRALLRVARDRSSQKSVRESKFAQEILAQVWPWRENTPSVGRSVGRSEPDDADLVSALRLQYRARQLETDRDLMRAFRAEAFDYLTMLHGVQEQRVRWIVDLLMDGR